MERRDEVKVKSGTEYDHLFPKAMLSTIIKKKGATVEDTIRFIPQVVRDTLFHTQKIAKELKAENIRETCRAIWQFVYDHIAYKKDEEGKEQVRSPARAWHDRGNRQGVDCDCYSVFISSILSNLKIKHRLRITKYKEDHFQHIYPIVPLNDGRYITIDCVVRNFDYEEPYSEKKDTKMDLEYLNGVEDSNANTNIDAIELLGKNSDREAMAELGSIFNRNTSAGKTPLLKNINIFNKPSGGNLPQVKKENVFTRRPPVNEGQPKNGLFQGKVATVVKQTLHVTNRINPATVLLRTGILASMKLNVLKVSQRLKYAYLSDTEAQKRGIDMGKFARLKQAKQKLETIFYGAGGKPENLKEAILTGRGNANQDVKGLGELGEPVTASTIVAASGVIGAIAGLLKSIGNIFPKKDKAAADFEEGGEGVITTNAEAGITNSETSEAGIINAEVESINSENNLPIESENQSIDVSENTNATEQKTSLQKTTTESGSGGNTQGGFWEKNKKWIKPVGIGAGVVSLLYAGYRVVSGKKKPKTNLSGIPKSRKKQKQKGGKRAVVKSSKKKEAVTLL